MNTMKALCFDKYGPPSVLALTDRSTPEPEPGQVQVQVQAPAINPSDVKNVAGAVNLESNPTVEMLLGSQEQPEQR